MKWSVGKISTVVDQQPAHCEIPPFSYPIGPTDRTRGATTPMQVLKLLLTTVILENIVQQTKLFACQRGANFQFCIEELLAFIAINIAMGLLRLPELRDYWCRNEIIATPWFASIMSRDRFLLILRYLHLNDSSQQKKPGEVGHDPLYKVRPLLDHLSAVFPLYYQPSQNLSIDEMMIGTRCRVSFLQFLPKKPTRFGIKVWVNAEASTGYTLGLQVYTGAEEGSSGKMGLGYRVVMALMELYQQKNHCLYIDNFYTSPQLLLDLLDKGIYCTGTVRTNRTGFPVSLIPPTKSMNPGTYRFATACGNKLTAVWWRDRRDVFMMSTVHKKSVQYVMKRPKGSHEKQPMPCPIMIAEYNNSMGGVDLTDQQLSYYSMTTRKTLKWWKKVFWRLVDICIVNSWIIFRTNFPDSPISSHKAFRLHLITELVQPLLELKASPSCPAYLKTKKGRKTVSSETRLTGKHFSYKNPKRQRCIVCSYKKKDQKTQNYCPKCKVHVCLGKCFELYHTQTNYKQPV